MFDIISIIMGITATVIFYLKMLSPFEVIDLVYIFLFFLVSQVICFLLTVIFISLYSLTINKDKEYTKYSPFTHCITKYICQKILFFTNTHVSVKGMEKLPKNTRFLFVSNHKNSFDPICYNKILCGYNVAFISKPSNFNIPVIGRLVHREFYLPIDRDNDKEAIKTIIKAIKLCEKDMCSIGLYPEGTRNKTDKPLLEFKTGGLKIAQKANTPIVVSVIKNAKKLNLNPFNKSKISIEILTVIKPEDFEKSTVDLGKKIQDIMLKSIT